MYIHIYLYVYSEFKQVNIPKLIGNVKIIIKFFKIKLHRELKSEKKISKRFPSLKVLGEVFSKISSSNYISNFTSSLTESPNIKKKDNFFLKIPHL